MYSRFSIKKNAGDKDIDFVDDVAGGLENSLNGALGGVEEETKKLNALKKRKNAMDDINERINALMEEKAKLINDK